MTRSNLRGHLRRHHVRCLQYVSLVATVVATESDGLCQLQVHNSSAEDDTGAVQLVLQGMMKEDLGLMTSNAHLEGASLNMRVFSDCNPNNHSHKLEADGELAVERASLLEPKVHIPQPDFSGTVEMPREFVENYPQEFLGSLSMEENGITFETLPVEGVLKDLFGNDGCSACGGSPDASCACVDFAVLPMDHHFTNIEASRSTLHPKTHEHGEMRWIATIENDPQTAMIPGATVMFAEKFAVYDHEGVWQETEEIKPADWIDTEPSEVSDDSAVLGRAAKVYEFYAATRLGSLQNAAAFDPASILALSEYLARFPLATANDMQQATDMDAQFQAARDRVRQLPEGTDPASIVTSCFHLMEHDLLILEKEQKKVKIPLNVQVPFVRAQNVMFPRYEISQAIGKGVFRIDSRGGRLVFHLGAITYGSYLHQRANHGSRTASSIYGMPPKLYVTSSGGVGEPSDFVKRHDLRATPHGMEPLSDFQSISERQLQVYRAVFLRYATLPMSYVWLYRNQTQVCPARLLKVLQSQVASSDWHVLKKDGKSAEDFKQFAHGLLPAFACGLSFVKGAARYSTAVDALEVMAFAHWMMEWPAVSRFHALRGSEYIDSGHVGEDCWDWKNGQAGGTASSRFA